MHRRSRPVDRTHAYGIRRTHRNRHRERDHDRGRGDDRHRWRGSRHRWRRDGNRQRDWRRSGRPRGRNRRVRGRGHHRRGVHAVGFRHVDARWGRSRCRSLDDEVLQRPGKQGHTRSNTKRQSNFQRQRGGDEDDREDASDEHQGSALGLAFNVLRRSPHPDQWCGHRRPHPGQRCRRDRLHPTWYQAEHRGAARYPGDTA